MKAFILVIIIILSSLITSKSQTNSEAVFDQNIVAGFTAMEITTLTTLDSLETQYRNTDSAQEHKMLIQLMSECDKALSFISAMRSICLINPENSTNAEMETALRQICSMRKSSYIREEIVDSLTMPYIMLMAKKNNPFALNMMGLKAMNNGDYSDANRYFAEAITVNEEIYLPALHNYSMSNIFLASILRKKGNIEEADKVLDIAQTLSKLYTDYIHHSYDIATNKSATGPHTAAEYYHHKPNAAGSDNYKDILRLLRGEYLANMINTPPKHTGKGITESIRRRTRSSSGRNL